jgi:hypothetical protein
MCHSGFGVPPWLLWPQLQPGQRMLLRVRLHVGLVHSCMRGCMYGKAAAPMLPWLLSSQLPPPKPSMTVFKRSISSFFSSSSL